MTEPTGAPRGRWNSVATMLDSISGAPGLDPAWLSFRIGLARIYASVEESAREAARHAAATGKPIEPADLSPSSGSLAGMFASLISGAAGMQDSGDLGRLADLIEKEPEALVELARESVFAWDGRPMRRLAGRAEISLLSALMLGRTLAVPFLYELAEARTPQTAEGPETLAGGCPVCHAPAALARLRAPDGRRELVCTLCGTAWPVARIGCAFCGNRDSERLNQHRVEGIDGRWIESCADCRRYLKTTDDRLVVDPGRHPFVEETLGLPLDLVAEREGLVRRLY